MPTLGGNWIDLLILVFLTIYVWESIGQGFLVLVGEMASFILAFLVALRFYSQMAQFLMVNFSLSLEFAKALGFIFTAVGAEVVLGVFLSEVYRRLPRAWFTGKWNRALGFLPAVIDGVVLVGFVLTAMVGLPISGVVKHDVLGSRIGGILVGQARGLERSINDVFGGAIEQTMNFLTVKTGSRERVDLHFRTSEYVVDAQAEKEMLALVNQERINKGIEPLVADDKLREVARAYSKDMFERGYFSHINSDGKDPFDRMGAAGVRFGTAGENLAYAPTVMVAHEGLMNSSEHRANVLNKEFKRVGIGIVDGGGYGKMFTQDFAD
jgi:uncharacterized protein YkwD/uncharacterized membrane protein required for colicin V production